jgi:sterol desaturase/sphingolipid hydroxylase (fatty acid hydroxylase superfamily)
MREFILNCSAWEIAALGLAFFGGIYLLFGAVNIFITHQLLPRLHIGKPLDPRPLAKGQLKRELLWSASSIAIFGVGMVFPWGFLQLGWAGLAVDPSWLQIAVEFLVLLVWNEIHFYSNHWLLHTPWLRRFHLPHHRSVVTTPWSTYAFHPVEALMLGNVILLPMLVHDFSVYALLSVPLFSLLFNSIGHSNYDWNPAGHTVFHNASRRHHLHHACFHGNYGFMFPFMDKVFKTALRFDAADKQINRWQVD